MIPQKQHKRRFYAEWEPQDAILLAWPHLDTDWAPYLAEVESLYCTLTQTIGRYQDVIILTPQPDHVQTKRQSLILDHQVHVIACPTQDTWTRDFGPLSINEQGQTQLLDFQFNGWGNKYPADLDNQTTTHLYQQPFIKTPCDTIALILEGGSVETDGAGTLLTTETCLLNPNRNAHKNRSEIESELSATLGVTRFLWLKHGHLIGDDTDAHIDTLVRFAPQDILLYVQCTDPEDEHYEDLNAMERELQAFRTVNGISYDLRPLPWPQARYESDGHRLPLTYANFVIINGAVLVPTYNIPQDKQALDIIEGAFPDREIIGIDCSVLVRQHGSLHCITMQLPQGVLA